MRDGRVLLAIHDVDVVWNDHVVLDKVTLRLRAGEGLCLTGGNGAGKTTLLRAIAGLVEVDRGDILLKGANLHDWPAYRRRRAGIAYLLQGARLFGSLDVESHLRVAKRYARECAKDVLECSYALMSMARIGLSAQARFLSGGQRQVVSLCMVLLSGAELLLLDEPTVGLADDVAALAVEVFGLLIGSGAGVILVEHGLPVALDGWQKASMQDGHLTFSPSED
jgi:ABC-type branched-subunit amino acid transport system ATPase component